MKRRHWKLVRAWKSKPQGQVWLVEDDSGEQGYFKFAMEDQWHYSGPMIGNELLAAALAKKLGFPVSDLEVATVRGPDGVQQTGVVSVRVRAREVVTWHTVPEHVWKHPERNVHRMGLLSSLVVFDAWIANVDRAQGKNLILFRSHSNDKYNWYLIDHGLALYGSPQKWTRGHWDGPPWDNLWAHYHVPRGLLRFQSSMHRLDPMIRKIASLTEQEIDHVLKKVPTEFLGEPQRNLTKRLLLYRQKHLRAIIRRWLDYKGTKEYRPHRNNESRSEQKHPS